MELYFLRHAIAKENGEFEGRDSERPLTDEGVEKMKKAAKGMKQMEIAPEAILSSPYKRASQTAEIAARALDFTHPIQYEDCLVPSGSPKELLKLLKNFPNKSKLLIVGHQPSLGEFVSAFVFGEPALTIDFKKGGLCRVDLPGPEAGVRGELKWLLTNSQLREMA